MAIESDADRAVMLADDGVTLSKVGETDITVLLDKEFVEFNDVAGYKPVARARSLDVVALSIVKGSSVTVDGDSYTVAFPQDDGSGFTRLILEAV